uniref:perilipin-2-like n=1 Tax=Scatophagus argus TaxID=75038 RepID=UPI001ED8535A|nr:perilipin-2-like [Scatophagus argus]
MPMNNNQRVESAAARLAKLPLVRSVCTQLSVLYTDTKRSHPNLRSACEGLEGRVTAAVSPVVVKLEPQISIANDLACKSLDWLETSFPALHAPTEQIVATAKNKMHEIQDAVSVAANGTVDCVQYTVTWLMGRTQQVDDQAGEPLVERAIGVASVGLDSALNMSEALMDRVLPPTEEDKEEEAHLLGGFEVGTPRRSYPVRLVSLAAKLYRRTSHMVIENLSRHPGLVQDLQTSWQTLAWSIHGLPQYMQHQLVSLFFFISQMYNLGCPPSQHNRSNQDRGCLNVSEISPHKDVVQALPQAPPPTCRKRRPAKSPVFDNGCNVKGCGHR